MNLPTPEFYPLNLRPDTNIARILNRPITVSRSPATSHFQEGFFYVNNIPSNPSPVPLFRYVSNTIIGTRFALKLVVGSVFHVEERALEITFLEDEVNCELEKATQATLYFADSEIAQRFAQLCATTFQDLGLFPYIEDNSIILLGDAQSFSGSYNAFLKFLSDKGNPLSRFITKNPVFSVTPFTLDEYNFFQQLNIQVLSKHDRLFREYSHARPVGQDKDADFMGISFSDASLLQKFLSSSLFSRLQYVTPEKGILKEEGNYLIIFTQTSPQDFKEIKVFLKNHEGSYDLSIRNF